MTSPSFDTYRRLAESVPVDETGSPLLTIGFCVELNFTDGIEPPQRQAGHDIYADYFGLTQKWLRWMVDPKTKHYRAMTPEMTPAHWLSMQPAERWVWFITAHGGVRFDTVSEYEFEALGTGPVGLETSFLGATFPATFFAMERPDVDPVALVRRWATWLKPMHGTAGLGVITPLDEGRHAAAGPARRALLLRHPGLDLHRPSATADWEKGLRCVNWLTVLGDALLATLGGVDAIRASLPAGLLLHEYPGGAILQAGPHPEAGDMHYDQWPAHYRNAARIVRPVQAEFTGAFRGFDPAESRDWLHRFD
ncbi:MAG: DUF3396 domain-containing protein [Gemmatimonadaceae bacterium]|jgi:hypothetical protein|nr:DUF3396 domain-containing protein [Gemmatimonadaceae bacterium]